MSIEQDIENLAKVATHRPNSDVTKDLEEHAKTVYKLAAQVGDLYRQAAKRHLDGLEELGGDPRKVTLITNTETLWALDVHLDDMQQYRDTPTSTTLYGAQVTDAEHVPTWEMT